MPLMKPDHFAQDRLADTLQQMADADGNVYLVIPDRQSAIDGNVCVLPYGVLESEADSGERRRATHRIVPRQRQ